MLPTLGVKLHTDTQYGRNELASSSVHNPSILIFLLYICIYIQGNSEKCTGAYILQPIYISNSQKNSYYASFYNKYKYMFILKDIFD